jgi:hypothetical protein
MIKLISSAIIPTMNKGIYLRRISQQFLETKLPNPPDTSKIAITRTKDKCT